MKKVIITGFLSLCVIGSAFAWGPMLKPLTGINAETRAGTVTSPVALDATNFTNDGFTANWSTVKDADSYLLNLYEKNVEDAIVIEDFDNLNIVSGTNFLDATNPGFTEGWTVTYGLTKNRDHISHNGYDGSVGMIFRATGEGFITPVYKNRIQDFSFYAAHPSGEPCMSTLVVLVMVNGEWGALGNYDIERISADGEIIRLSSNFPEGGVEAIQVYFKKNEQYDTGKDVDIIMDHIRLLTYPEGEIVKRDIPVSATSYAFKGLEPEKDYAYTIRAVKGEDISAESKEKMAVGLAAPELLDASNIGDGSYTANWKYAPKAEGYVVNSYKVYTVAQPSEEVDILHETFDKVTEGTLLNPVGLYNVVYPKSLDAYTVNPGWMGLANYLIEGMMGSRSYYIIQGLIQTPVLNLSGNNGVFTVKVKVLGDTDAIDEDLVVQAGMEIYQQDKIKPGEPVELEFTFDCGTSQMALAFYTKNGYPFYLDEVTVTQTLTQGSEVYYGIEEKLLEGSNTTSVEINNLTLGANEHPAYRVFSYRDFMGDRVYSTSYSVKHVQGMSSVGTIHDDLEEGSVSYYNLNGLKLKGCPTSPGVYIRVQGNKSEKIMLR